MYVYFVVLFISFEFGLISDIVPTLTTHSHYILVMVPQKAEVEVSIFSKSQMKTDLWQLKARPLLSQSEVRTGSRDPVPRSHWSPGLQVQVHDELLHRQPPDPPRLGPQRRGWTQVQCSNN